MHASLRAGLRPLHGKASLAKVAPQLVQRASISSTTPRQAKNQIYSPPLIRELVESGVGEDEGGVSLVTVEFDSPDIMSGNPNLAMTYMITSIPTLLSFDGGEAQTTTKLADARKLADREFLKEWIQNEARRHGGRGGGGGGGGSSVFGGLFGSIHNLFGGGFKFGSHLEEYIPTPQISPPWQQYLLYQVNGTFSKAVTYFPS
ncbi:hypothetical protein FSARC_3710 [Fusarium sarcochroum]|uniref:Thioredoxin-like protein n=1 Tax=Fusarium sarcochroum TaxID=1208366 RepID=A0A8H4U351_9HYPO|nr:hypothetical protein FSARC_3710 [Fusarium sarcochroum]